MTDFGLSKAADLPIACTLDVADGAARLERWRALSARGAPVVGRQADALVVTYPAGPGLQEELELLAAAERECCSFVGWEVRREDDRLVLTIRGGAEGLAAIEALRLAG